MIGAFVPVRGVARVAFLAVQVGVDPRAIRIVDVPSLALRENLAAHVGGCIAAALDPRGRYLASGGYDSIVNLFDTSEWIAARTITVCECVCQLMIGSN